MTTNTIMTHYEHLNNDLVEAMAVVAARETALTKARGRHAKAAALIALFAAQDVSDRIAEEIVSISNATRGFATSLVSPITMSRALRQAA